MTRLADRFGKTGLAALASVAWAVPMAAWAGSADLSPIDHTAIPWIAFTLGAVMLAAWVALVIWLRGVEVAPRVHRLDLAAMSAAEKRWTLALAASATGVLAWLNAAATVDWSPLTAAIGRGNAVAIVFAIALLGCLLALAAAAAFSWRRASGAYRARATAQAAG